MWVVGVYPQLTYNGNLKRRHSRPESRNRTFRFHRYFGIIFNMDPNLLAKIAVLQNMQNRQINEENAAEIRRLQELVNREANKPKCPHCGGGTEQGYDLCKNCGREVCWVGQIVCKPEDESQIRKEQEQQQERQRERQRQANKIARENEKQRLHALTVEEWQSYYKRPWNDIGRLRLLYWLLGAMICYQFMFYPNMPHDNSFQRQIESYLNHRSTFFNIGIVLYAVFVVVAFMMCYKTIPSSKCPEEIQPDRVNKKPQLIGFLLNVSIFIGLIVFNFLLFHSPIENILASKRIDLSEMQNDLRSSSDYFDQMDLPDDPFGPSDDPSNAEITPTSESVSFRTIDDLMSAFIEAPSHERRIQMFADTHDTEFLADLLPNGQAQSRVLDHFILRNKQVINVWVLIHSGRFLDLQIRQINRSKYLLETAEELTLSQQQVLANRFRTSTRTDFLELLEHPKNFAGEVVVVDEVTMGRLSHLVGGYVNIEMSDASKSTDLVVQSEWQDFFRPGDVGEWVIGVDITGSKLFGLGLLVNHTLLKLNIAKRAKQTAINEIQEDINAILPRLDSFAKSIKKLLRDSNDEVMGQYFIIAARADAIDVLSATSFQQSTLTGEDISNADTRWVVANYEDINIYGRQIGPQFAKIRGLIKLQNETRAELAAIEQRITSR